MIAVNGLTLFEGGGYRGWEIHRLLRQFLRGRNVRCKRLRGARRTIKLGGDSVIGLTFHGAFRCLPSVAILESRPE
jgi:hypothetical protein